MKLSQLKKIFLGLLTFTVISGSLLAETVSIGQPSPDFSLIDTQGKTIQLSSYKGKFVVLEWFNPDCPFVKKHYGSGNMQSLQKESTDKGVIWLSIDSSAPGKQGYYSPEKANELTLSKNASPTAVLLDSDGKLGKLYGAQTTPHMFVINPEGQLIYAGAIDNVASADPADITKATNYVREALGEAMAGKPVSVPSTKSYGCSVKY